MLKTDPDNLPVLQADPQGVVTVYAVYSFTDSGNEISLVPTADEMLDAVFDKISLSMYGSDEPRVKNAVRQFYHDDKSQHEDVAYCTEVLNLNLELLDFIDDHLNDHIDVVAYEHRQFRTRPAGV